MKEVMAAEAKRPARHYQAARPEIVLCETL
jgi:hypothetical protein